MYYLRLLTAFIRFSLQEELAYRANFWLSLLHSLLNLTTGILGIAVLVGQVRTVHGWNFASTLTLLGVYLILSALRGICIGPSLEALAGLGGEVWDGRFDFTLLRPLNAQLFASIRYWRLFALVDLLLGVGVVVIGIVQLRQSLTWLQVASFLLTLGTAILLLYAVLLAFTGLIFWSPGFLFTWVFNGLFQLARYPIGLYPGWLGFVLTWIVPVGIMTTVPAQAIGGSLSLGMLCGSVLLVLLLTGAASYLFQMGLRRYSSASS